MKNKYDTRLTINQLKVGKLYRMEQAEWWILGNVSDLGTSNKVDIMKQGEYFLVVEGPTRGENYTSVRVLAHRATGFIALTNPWRGGRDKTQFAAEVLIPESATSPV